MTRIECATYDEVRHVALNMRDRDFAEFSATSSCTTREELADSLARRFGDRAEVLCGSDGLEPICIGGTIEVWPNVVSLLFFATPEFPRIGLPITRFIRDRLFPQFDAAGVHRIQAVSLANYHKVHAWLRVIGLSPETDLLRRYGKNGEDFIQFARIGRVRAPGA